MPCPPASELADFTQGVLEPQAAEAVEEHLATCAICCECVGRVAPSGEPAAVAAVPGLDPAWLPAGMRLGRYVVERRLGSGAMGVVYTAFDPELHRRVALKVLRAAQGGGKSPDESRGRFVREARALARVSHPNVVAIFDAGTEAGVAFLAMELVDGQSLRRWLEAEPRSTEAVLAAFAAAGAGLDAAHQAGIVHRDFKPDNVLVGVDGRIRVMDFGLAHALDGPPGDFGGGSGTPTGPVSLGSFETEGGRWMGTPRYMSPEQAAGAPPDARSDQFAFCVGLYEALFKEAPFVGTNLQELTKEVRAGRLQVPPAARAAPQLLAALRRGLSADPSQRFPAMKDLLEKLRGRRWNKWRRRALATAAASLLVLLGVGGWLAWQPRCALASVAGIWDAPRRSAAREALGKAGLPYVKDLASRIDEAMARHLADWSQAHDAICAAPRLRGMDPPAQARLRCLDAQLVQVRAFADLFAEADAGVVENAARALEALPTARACVGRTPSLSGPTQPRNADEERLLRETARLQAELAAGRFEKVASEAEGLLVEARRRGAPSLESELLLIRGTALVESGHAEASQVLQEAAVVAGNAQRDDLAARALLKLGFNAAINTRSLVEGRKWTARAKDIIDRLGDQGVLRAGLDSVDGVLLALEDKPDEALVALQSALDRYAQVLGPDHRQVGGAENNLGLALFKLGRWEEAKPHFERAAAIQEATLGPSHPGLAKILHGLATAHRHLGEYDRAIEQSNRSLQILTDAHRENTPLAAQLRSGLGRVLLDKGEAAQALREQDAARELFEKLAGPTHSDLGVIEEERGRALLALGRWADALSAAERSLGIAEKRWGEKDPRLAYPLAEIGLAHLGLGEPERALAPLERALDISATARAPDEARPAARLALARALWALDREPERALELARQAQQELAKGNAAARRDALVAGALVADHESPPGSTKK